MSKATDDNWPTMQHWWGTPDEMDEHLRELIDKYIDITGDDGSWDGCQTWVNDWFWQARQEVK